MKRRVIVVLALAASLLLTAGVVAAAGTIIDGFEDGDTTEWSQISSPSEGNFTTSQTNPYNGSYHLIFEDEKDNDGYRRSVSPNSPANLSLWVDMKNIGDDNFRFVIENSSNFRPVETRYNGQQNEIQAFRSGQSNLNISKLPPTDQYMKITHVLDYTNSTYDVWVYYPNGTVFGSRTDISFDKTMDSVSSVGVIGQDGSDGTIEFTVHIDDISVNTTAPSLPAGDINGTVVDQDGDPVKNATVNILQVNKTELDAQGFTTAAELERKANNLRDELSDPRPDGICNANLLSASGFSFCQDTIGSVTTPSDLSSKYVAVHNVEQWDADDVAFVGTVAPTVEAGISLPNPPTFKFKEAPAEVVLSVWDPAKERWGELDAVDRQLHGEVIEEGVVVRQVDPFNGTVNEYTFDPEPFATTGPLGEKKYGSYAVLDEGFYWVRPESGGHGYFIKVGNPVPELQDALKTEAKQLSDRAQWIRNRIQNNTFEISKVSTNNTGHFSFSAPSQVHNVVLEAYKGPYKDVANDLSKFTDWTDAKNSANISDLRMFFENSQYNGSFYLPSEPRRAAPGDTNLTLVVRELNAPPHSNQTRVEDAWEWLQDFLRNHSYEEALSVLKQRISQLEDDEVRNAYAEIYNLIRHNRQLEDRANELVEKNEELTKTLQEYENQLNSTNVTKLEQTIEEMEQALAEQQSTVGTGDGTSTIANESLTASRVFDADLDDDSVLAIIEFANGSSTRLTPDSQYMRIEDGILSDTVHIEDYPVGDSPVVAVQWTAVTTAGVARATDQARNPTFGGDIPALDAIDVSSLAPGPNDRVEVNLHPRDGAAFGSLQNLTVYGPDDNGLSTNVTGGRTAAFTTNGVGTHRVEAVYSDASGQNFTTTFHLLAEDEDRPMDPGLRVVESVVGTYALTGDGLDGGSVDVSGGGATAQINARIQQDGEVPETLHIYAHGLSLAPEARTNIAVVRGDDGRTVSQNVRIVYHGPAIGTDGIAWRHADGDRDALPLDSGDQGWVERNATGTTIHTITGDNGRVGLETIRDPGIFERAWHGVQLRVQGLDDLTSRLPFVGGVAFLFGIPAGWREYRRRGGGQHA